MALKDVSGLTGGTMTPYKTVPAISAKFHGGTPTVYEIDAADFLLMEYTEAEHALTHGHAATVTPDVWAALQAAGVVAVQEVAA